MNWWKREVAPPDRISLISRRTWNGGHGEPARVVIEGDRIGVWVADRGTVRQIDAAVVLGLERSAGGWEVTTPDGVWDVARGGCGCGSPIKHYEPSLPEEAATGAG